MVGELSLHMLSNLINKEECPICTHKYTNNMYYSFDNKEYNMDSLNNNIMQKNIIKVKDNEFFGEKIFIKDRELLKKTFKKFNLASKPYKLKCCNNIICGDCIENHINHTNNIICPYCKHDHNHYDKKFIEITEPTKYNKIEWQKWWRRHLDIFM